MAKKKRKPSARRRSEESLELPDPRLIENQMRRLIPGAAGADDTPLARAQLLVMEALGESKEKQRILLAKKALEICPDCADAYVLWAENAHSRKEAAALYEQGVAAGERALGPRLFQEQAGHFWGLLETRPYMRARQGLAHTLWSTGHRDEAIQHLQELLRLNPGDNQGNRYTLANFLLTLDRDEGLAQLLAAYPEECSAAWMYNRAILVFRQHGDTPETRQALKKALKSNKHVPDYLLGQKYPPAEQPAYIGMGDENEALSYIAGFLASWKATPGAIAWLREIVKSTGKTAPPAGKGPLTFVKRWLKERLPQEPDVWQADCRHMTCWVKVAGEKIRPQMFLVASATTNMILVHDVQDQEPRAELIWDTLVKAMQNPLAGEPHRPTELHVHPHDRWDFLKPHLAEVGIQLVIAEQLPELDVIFKDANEHIGGKPAPGLLDMPGIKPEQVGRFFDAAASFYQQAPWRKIGYEAAIQIECPKFKSGPWYGVLMGQSGLTMGLAVYEDLKVLKKLWAGDFSDEQNARMSVTTSVTFGDEVDLPVADLEAAKQHGWKVAAPDAYPMIFHKERGMTTRPPLAWELELMEGCLRAIPEFVLRRKQDDPTREETTVPVASGPLPLALSWVDTE